MDMNELNRIVFKEAIDYLWQNANPEKFKHYFNEPKVNSINEAFEIAVSSVRDITVIGNIIKYDSNVDTIKECLLDYDVKKVLNEYGDGKDDRCLNLYNLFRKKINSNAKDGKNNSWYK